MNNKFLQLLLPLLTLLSLATTALAQTEQAEEPTTSGTGWSYNTSSNTLIISSSITWSEIQTTYLKQNTKNVIFTSDCGISTIQERAFAQFWQLETIILSPSVTSIATQSFHMCEAIKSFIVISDPDNTHTLTISEQNIELKNASFYCASETKLEFSDSDFDGISTNDITSGNGWFYDTSSNTLVILSSSAWDKIGSGETKKYLKKNTQTVIFTSAYESTELIDEGAFEDFISLTSVDLSNTSITSLGDYPFYGCGELTSIKFPNTLESIGESAFEDCEKLTSIDLSKTSIKTIDENVFYGCALTSVNFPNTLASIGESAFYGCTSLTSIDLSNTAITSIDDKVFQGFSSLSSITLPKNLTSIGKFAFSGCTSLSSINLSETSLSSIGLSAFYQCKALTTLTFPNTLSTIGGSAFYGCTSLSSINLPETSLSSIGGSAFYGCTSLSSINLPETSLTSIDGRAFYGCTSLTSIVIPASITSISQRTFYGCTSLASITIPASVTKMEDFAFSHCPAKNVYIESNTKLTEPQVIILGTNSNQVADYGADVFTPDADATLHYNSLYTNIGAEGTTQNFRHYFTNLDDANAESTNLQSPTNNSSTPLYYDLQGRPLSQPLPNTPVIRILNNRSTLILTK